MNKIGINKNVIDKKTGLLLASLASILSACVTINIYFPAAAADKAADKIIEEVWQLKDGEKAKDATQPTPPVPAPTPAPEAK